MKVTPLSDAPTIPNATTYQGADRLARKNPSSPLLPPVNFAIKKSTAIYVSAIVRNRVGVIVSKVRCERRATRFIFTPCINSRHV